MFIFQRQKSRFNETNITRACSGPIDKAMERRVVTPQPMALSIAAEVGVILSGRFVQELGFYKIQHLMGFTDILAFAELKHDYYRRYFAAE